MINIKKSTKVSAELSDHQQLIKRKIITLAEKTQVKEKPKMLPLCLKVDRYPIF